MSVEEFHEFLLKNSGVTARVLHNLWYKTLHKDHTEPPVRSLFFKRFECGEDLLLKGANIITDPLFLSYCAVVGVFTVVYYLCDSIYRAFTLDTDTATSSILKSAAFVLITLTQIIAAAISPLVNFIDLFSCECSTACMLSLLEPVG